MPIDIIFFKDSNFRFPNETQSFVLKMNYKKILCPAIFKDSVLFINFSILTKLMGKKEKSFAKIKVSLFLRFNFVDNV